MDGSILLRNTVNISADDKLEPLLGYFKKGLTHIGVVTEIQVRDQGQQAPDRSSTAHLMNVVVSAGAEFV